LLKRRQTLAVFLTLAIIGALLFIPQASAITVAVSGITSGETITRGEVRSLTFTITIESGERVPIQKIRVVVDGSTYSAEPTGGSLDPSNAIIPSISSPSYPAGYGYGYGYLYGYGYSYGYGYGYGYGYPYGYGYGFVGPTQIRYTALLYTANLGLGPHSLRVEVETGLQPTGVFSSQTISFTIVAPPPVPPAPPAPPSAAELEALPPEERAAKLLQVSTEDAARRVEEMSVDKAAEAIRVMNATAAAKILNLVNTTRLAAILTTLPLNHSAQVTLELKVDRAAEAVLTMNVTTAAQLIQTTVTINITRTAQIVDTMVAVNVTRAAAIVEQLPTETLVNLLVEITRLPSTPEKAAKLLDAMSLSKAVDAVKTLIASDKLQTLAQIFAHVSTPRLNDIFKQLTSAERLRALPYLDAATQARLKHVKASFTVEKVEAQPGASVKITLQLSATQPIPEGAVTFNVPTAFKTKAISVEGLGAASREDGRLVVTKSAAQPSYSTATVTFDLVVPLNASVSVGQIVNVAVSVDVPDFAVSFDTPTTISITVVKPTVQSIFSALNSYFDKTVSGYTEGRVPVKQDIYALLDFYFRGRVD
ncbi:MAG: hypothetical protein HA494_00035, partial [Thaumarchaeota archaeon]|nr:hypothetical protein [Nitrososphaerota archaeon]